MRSRGTPVLLATPLLLALAACGEGQEGGERGTEAGGAGIPGAEEALPEGAQARSFLGEPLFPPRLPAEVGGLREEELKEALAALEADPAGADPLIWAGRRYAYLGEYRQAIQVFSLGIELHPRDARFLRHRGHRLITVRELDAALADFRQAVSLVEGAPDEIEPDGQPNALGVPTSSLQFNIWYHYGLAHYLKGEFSQAAEAYRRCMEVSAHPDSRVATAHWWYMSLRRQGLVEEAADLIRGMDLEALAPQVIESGSYLDLLRLYASATGGGQAAEGDAGGPDPESLEGATLGYGLGAWELYNGNTEGALGIFRRIVEARDQWASFGYIAAEAELARMGARQGG